MDHLPKHPEHPPEEDPASDCALDLTKKKMLSPEVPPSPSLSGASPSVPMDFLSQPATHHLPYLSHPELAPSVAAPQGLVPFPVPVGEIAHEFPAWVHPDTLGRFQLPGQRRRYKPRKKKEEATATTPKPIEERMKATPVPDEQKDDANWERRRKNNEAAKKSRDARRQRTDEIEARANFLEHEVVKGEVEIEMLKAQNQQLQDMVYGRHYPSFPSD